jgi:NAD(P)H dehydrogenase (quinone)
MNRPKILVTGATGRTGAAVVAELLKAGYPVRALVRREDGRAAALRARGVEIAVADIVDAERITAAMSGVHRAYWLPPYDREMLTGAAAFATAARGARLEAIVSLSQWLASPTHPAFLTRQHWLADHIFATLPDVALTLINPGFFADSPYLATVGMAAHLGMMPWLFGESLSAPPSVDDIARVAATALMDPQRHAGRTYRPTGPALLSGGDMAAILSRVFGRTVRLVPTPLWVFLKAAHLDGQPIALLSCMEHYIEEQRRGAFAIGAPNDDVARVTGQPPESFETVARRLASLPANRRSPSRTLRELARLLTVPLARGPNMRRYLRGLQIIAPAAPQYTGESAVWRREHGVAETETAATAATRTSRSRGPTLDVLESVRLDGAPPSSATVSGASRSRVR